MTFNLPPNFLSSNVEYLRKKNNMSQAQLGKLVNKDYSTIGKWEKGINQPSIEDSFKLAIIFNVDWSSLIRENLRNSKANSNDTFTLYDNNKDILTKDDEDYIKFIIEKRKKESEEEKKE